MNDEDHDGHTINLGPPAGSTADERPKWDPREEDDWYPPHAPSTPVDEAGGRRMETLLSRFAWLADSARSEGFHEAAAAYTVCRDELSDALTPAPSSDTPSDGCDDCEREGRNCTAHGGRPGIPTSSDTPSDGRPTMVFAEVQNDEIRVGDLLANHATVTIHEVGPSAFGWGGREYELAEGEVFVACGDGNPHGFAVTRCDADGSHVVGRLAGEERRPVDGGERSQSEQWFVVHHNQIRSLRFRTFPIERLARASIAACTCGPHTLRHTVTTTYTASTTEEFVAAATDRGGRA